MDAVDCKILAELQRDGRITVTDLAGRVRLSISRCQRRLRELERDGVIRGYRAVVDAAALGFGFEALVFAKLRLDTMHDFDRALADVPNVVEAQRLFGSPDYLLRVVTADLTSYQRLYEETLAKLPGVRGLTSTIVMKHVIEPRPLPGP
ncbi:Lrp/AsnC family transcriptional regulator [Lentzea sp. NPDC059081]|uniref:Lrp/AsnC family transcriptional regulator n=1 Tax=Lentzea sp. NPDC059081 TaxID=3346719 RepID=UPI003678CE3B